MRGFLVLLGFLAVVFRCHADKLIWCDGNRGVTYTVVGERSTVVDIALDLFDSDMRLVTGHGAECLKKGGKIRLVQLDKVAKVTAGNLRMEGVPVDTLMSRMDAFYIHVGKDILVVGSNGRGTAYGLLELSRKAGVSPWVWWGDVIPERKSRLTIESGFTTLQSPSVEYRGIFLNDEDFALRRWSSNLRPQTYRKIFELLLRLRANTIWPAMHPGTTPFFTVLGNKALADSFDIVVGTSHCEPLLRNNVGEWNTSRRGEYNYITNRDSVLGYWAERLKDVAGNDNYIYTLGMRGIHDGSMAGVKTMDEKVRGLNDVIRDQRQLLSRYLNKDVTHIPQIFVPYKEVLQIMEQGVNVPEDVALMWCDDNYGYMTHLSSPEQQQRRGGAGVYYHLSYWGQPHDYLWLTTQQPGLIYSEMKEAYDHNARRLWIANVHDPKVAAYDLELFLDMAWNISSISANTLESHLRNWLTTQFGADAGRKLTPVMKEWYRLVGIRKPEFMGWCQTELDKKRYNRGWSPVADSEFSMVECGDELDRYLGDYDSIVRKTDEIAGSLRPELRDAFFAHILYPVKSSAAMAEKQLMAQKSRRTGDKEAGRRAIAAYRRIQELTKFYNDTLSEGKWRNNMNCHPRDLLVFGEPVLCDTLPKINLLDARADSSESVARNAFDYQKADVAVSTIEMLGHSMKAVSIPKGCSVTYSFTTASSGEAILYTAMIPTQCNDKGDIRYSISIDGEAPVVISLKEKFRSPQWKLNVLRGQALKKTPVILSEGTHTLTIKALDGHIIADQWMIDFSKDRHFYLII